MVSKDTSYGFPCRPLVAPVLLAILAALMLARCSKKPAGERQPQATATLPAAAALDPEGAPAPRPAKLEHALTESQRRRIEQRLPETGGFLLEGELEEAMKRDKKIDRRERALDVFDGLAKDRWVLFVGPMLSLDSEGFDMAIAFIPESRRDKLAVTRLWFNVGISQIKGYRPVLLREGQESAVLARYRGDGKASPAYDLVALGLW